MDSRDKTEITIEGDPGSLFYVAASDSCAADKARADLVCNGRNDAASISDTIARMAAPEARGGKLVFFPGTYIVDSWTERSADDGILRRYGICIPHSQSEIAIEGIGYTHKDANLGRKYRGGRELPNRQHGCAAARSHRRPTNLHDRPRLRLLRHRPEPHGLAHRKGMERMTPTPDAAVKLRVSDTLLGCQTPC